MRQSLLLGQVNEEAQAAYAAAWEMYLLTGDEDLKRSMEETMDSLQPKIADNPADPRWQNFIQTLPGFTDFWKNWGKEVLKRAHLGRK